MIYRIFNQTVSFNIESALKPILEKQLSEQFSLYPAEMGNQADLNITFVDEMPKMDIIDDSEPDHSLLLNGFIINYHKCTIAYLKDKIGFKIYIKLHVAQNPIIHYLKKINNIEFANIENRVGNVVSELVLTPLIFSFPKMALIHSAGLVHKGGAVLLGGKGGVGKTSLSIKLCSDLNYRFLNDDIAVIDENGLVYPNLAFPKIYGYNLINNQLLQKKIFQDRKWDDMLVWNLKRMIFGSAKVRRKISPLTLFEDYQKQPAALTAYIILKRVNSSRIKMKTIAASEAAEITLQIINSEFAYFIEHLKIQQKLCRKHNLQPLIDIDRIQHSWKKLYEVVFSQAECREASIPQSLQHDAFIRSFGEMLRSV